MQYNKAMDIEAFERGDTIMIKVTLTNTMLNSITTIEWNRFLLSTVELPALTRNRLRKNSKKKNSYASNRIEGNPLSERQAEEVIDSDPHKHLLKPEQEIRNYFLALKFPGGTIEEEGSIFG